MNTIRINGQRDVDSVVDEDGDAGCMTMTDIKGFTGDGNKLARRRVFFSDLDDRDTAVQRLDQY